MRVDLAIHDKRDRSEGNAKPLSQLFQRGISCFVPRLIYSMQVEPSNFADLIVRQFSSCLLCGWQLYSWIRHSILLSRIVEVVFLRSEKKVIGPDTSRIIAFVAYLYPIRDFSEVKLPGISMRKDVPGCGEVPRAVRPFLRPNFPEPKPAAVGLVDFFPETLGMCWQLHGAGV